MPDEKPPIFSSWKKMYLFVLINLAVTITVFYIITKALQ
jgi:hypothetical protein